MLHNPINIDSEISKAKSYVKKGNLDLAKKIYEKILTKFPQNMRAKSGLINLEKNNSSISTNNQSIKLKLDEIVNLYNKKNFIGALELGLELFTSEYKNYFLCNILGAIYSMLMEPEQAEYYYKKSIEINPGYDGAYSNLATCYRGKKNFELAIEFFNKALKINPNNSEVYNNLGLVYKDLENSDKAIECYRKSLELNSKNILAISNIGLEYRKLKDLDKSIEYFDKCIDLQSNYFEAFVNRASVKTDKGDFQSAITDLEKALELNPNCGPAYNNMGSVYTELGEPTKAMTYLKKATEINPNDSEAYNNMGIASEFSSNHSDAVTFFKKALELDSNNHNASSFLSFHYFVKGEYEKFQSSYKSRLSKKGELNHIELNKTKSYLDLENLNNKNIIAYDEQGIGDEVNFVGLLPLFKKKTNSKITIICSDRLVDIYKSSFPEIPVFSRKEIAEDNSSYDCEMPMGSFLEYIDLEDNLNLPLKPYLKTPVYLTSYWKKELESWCNGKKIGISWKGGITPGQKLKRSLSLTELMNNLPKNGNYISLQYGNHEDEINKTEIETGRKIIHLPDIDPMKELDNQLSIMSNLDHVITVQSSTVHFAGALGIPVTALLSVSPDFRYGIDGNKSKFYESVQYIRQNQIGKWDNVLENLNKNFVNFFGN